MRQGAIIVTIEWIRDRYYTTRAGEKVRLICTDAPGEYPLIILDEDGDPTSLTIGGSVYQSCDEDGRDITGPWVEPVKPLEVWLNYYDCTYFSTWESEAKAREFASPDYLRIAVHMREVQS